MTRKPVIGVMGGHVSESSTMELARDVGRAIAKQGWILLNGGRNEGVMAASAEGCHEAGGFSVGLHPGGREAEAAVHLDLVIRTGIGFARNAMNVLTSDALIFLPGSAGTMSEFAYSRTFNVPSVLLGFDDHGLAGPDVPRAKTVDEAMELIAGML